MCISQPGKRRQHQPPGSKLTSLNASFDNMPQHLQRILPLCFFWSDHISCSNPCPPACLGIAAEAREMLNSAFGKARRR
jgi:hypothetical protein